MLPRFLWPAACVLLISACGDGSPGATPSPALSPVPSTVAIDLELADRLYVEGATANAVRIYSAAVLRGTADEKQRGLWALARIQYETGDAARSTQNARAFLAADPESEDDERRAYLLLGYGEMAQGHHQEAKEALEKYIRLAGPATPYAQLRLAEITAIEEGYEDAARGVEEALAAELPAPAATDALFALARYQEEAEDIPSAIATLQRLVAATADDAVEVLWEQARLYDKADDPASAQSAYTSLILDYPAHERALEALPLSEEIGLQSRAFVLFLNRQNDAARDAYEELAESSEPEVWGEAHYRLGILAERAGDPQGALTEYSFVIDNNGGSWKARALWDRATVLESLGRLDEAVSDFTRADDLSGYLKSGDDGIFRAGLIRYRQGRAGEAVALWASETDGFPPELEADARTYYWLGRAYSDIGDSQQAFAQFHEADPDPFAYYGLRAITMLSTEQPPSDPAALASSPPDWAAVESWITTFAGPEPSPLEDPFLESPGWLRAEELLEAGLVEETIAEVGALIESLEQLSAFINFPFRGTGSLPSISPTPVAQDPIWVLYRIARRMTDEGYPRRAALAAEAISRGRLLTAPPALLTLIYPARHLDAVNAAAQAEDVSPLLLFALVRQESWFDASAVSPAGALGLTQVIPATGEDIAADLGLTDFRESDLLDPETSLRFGAHYLAQQIEAFGGNIAAALAAYNGGPGNAGRWTETAGADPDLLLETIDFEETRLYVRLVLENYALYRHAYGVTDELSLPLD